MLAKQKQEPMAIIAAWREIGKACGFYQAERVKMDLNIAGQVEMGRFNQMTDAELLALMASGGAVRTE